MYIYIYIYLLVFGREPQTMEPGILKKQSGNTHSSQAFFPIQNHTLYHLHFFLISKNNLYKKKERSKASICKELQQDTRDVQKINNRTSGYPQSMYNIQTWFSKSFFEYLAWIFILKSPVIRLSPYGPNNATCSLPHYPITMASKHPSPNS